MPPFSFEEGNNDARVVASLNSVAGSVDSPSRSSFRVTDGGFSNLNLVVNLANSTYWNVSQSL